MTALKPNVVIYLIDDMDLERVPFYPRLDRGAAAQLEVHRRGNACRRGLANCTYTAPTIESIGERGVRFLGAHVPVSVCTPSRYALLTGRLPSSAPFYSGTHTGHFDAEGTVDISWNTFITQGVGPLCTRQRTRGCERRAQTLGDMLHRASYFTGFVGKWHVSSPAAGVQAYFRGSHGRIGIEPNTTAEQGAAAAERQRGYTEARKELHADVERSGFNYSGAISVGNVIDLAPLGLAVHNVEWETEASLALYT
jgi:arylsulfatase A-like enzyme